MKQHNSILVIDQGTTSSRAIVFTLDGRPAAVSQKELQQYFPDDGWVEHDPEEIWSTTLQVCRDAMQTAKSSGHEVAAIGITNQRETTILWDRDTGKPLYRAIVWQDRRTTAQCEALDQAGAEALVREHSGLVLDPYFSCTKIAWILDHVDGARQLASQGRLAFGTVDSFLIWRLTGGRKHLTDITNASRTGLFNIHTLDWDAELLSLFNVPASVLPEVMPCATDFGETGRELFGRPIPILGVAGDQQAAAIGQCCFGNGNTKSTYGTGCFVLINTGADAILSANRLLTTIAFKINNQVSYALEGSIFIAGAAIQWLRDELGIISTAAESETLAAGLDDNAGVYLVPAFTGLGAPHWQPRARGALSGITRSTGRAQLARAALEAVCYQTADLLTALQVDGIQPDILRVDGGMVANNWMMQFLADILDVPVDRPQVLETTALGAACLAGLQLGIYSGLDDIAKLRQVDRVYEPAMPAEDRVRLLAGWQRAIDRVKSTK